MPLTVSQHPPQLHYSRDEAWIALSSQNHGPPQPAFLRLNVKQGLSVGDTIEITFQGTTLTFTAASSPDALGLSLPTQSGGQSLKQYAVEIMKALRRNATLSQSFDSEQITTANGNEIISLESKDSFIDDIACTPSNLAAVGVFSINNPNLDDPIASALIECYNIDFGGRESLGRRVSPVDAARNTTFDLAASISLQAALPPSTQLDPGIAIGAISGNIMLYELRYGLQLGTPPAVEAFEPYVSGSGSESMLAVHGRSPAFGYNPLTTQTPGNGIYVLNAIVEREELLPEQPCFRYIVATEAIIGLAPSIRITIYRSSSSIATISTTSLGSVGIGRGGSFVIPVGFYQLLLDTATDSESITHYTATLVAGGVDVDLGTFMLKRECPDYRATLLFDNQIGGCDTLVLEGDQVWSNPTEVNPVRTPSTINTSYQFTEGTRTGDHIVEGSTGYVSKTRAQHIANALPARAWILSNGGWLPGYLNKTSDVYLDTSTNLASVPLAFTLAAPQR